MTLKRPFVYLFRSNGRGLASVCPSSRSLTFRIPISSTLWGRRHRSNPRCNIIILWINYFCFIVNCMFGDVVSISLHCFNSIIIALILMFRYFVCKYTISSFNRNIISLIQYRISMFMMNIKANKDDCCIVFRKLWLNI